jgi:Ca2+-binding RTX toxin-like protein
VKLTSQSAGVDIDMSSAGGPFGYHLVAFADGVKLTGSAFGDSLQGQGGIDTIVGNAGTDTVTGGTGADIINAGSGTNAVTDGGSGADVITHNSASSTVGIAVTGTGEVTLTATTAGATTNSAAGVNTKVTATNSTATVVLNSGTGLDTLTGGSGADTITGAATGIDSMTGGTGADTFVFAAVTESPGTIEADRVNTADFITDFATVDKFNLNSVTVDFTAAATATVVNVTVDAIDNFDDLKAAMITAVDDGAALKVSTTTSAQVYDVTITGAGLSATGGFNRLLIVQDGTALLGTTDLYINLQDGAPAVAAGNFTFTA